MQQLQHLQHYHLVFICFSDTSKSAHRHNLTLTYKEKSRHHDGYFSKVLVCFLRYKKDCVVVLISSAKVLLFFDIHNSKMYVWKHVFAHFWAFLPLSFLLPPLCTTSFYEFCSKIGCEQIVTYASNNFYVPQLSVINYSWIFPYTTKLMVLFHALWLYE